jgi:hypothetical protein
MGGADDVAACGDRLGGHSSNSGSYFIVTSRPALPRTRERGVDRHRLPDGIVDDILRFVLQHVPRTRNMQVGGARDGAGYV